MTATGQASNVGNTAESDCKQDSGKKSSSGRSAMKPALVSTHTPLLQPPIKKKPAAGVNVGLGFTRGVSRLPKSRTAKTESDLRHPLVIL